jgi:hypothetical protein
MTKPYFLPLREADFTGPKRSIFKSSKGLEVEITLFALKEVFENLPF